MIDSDSVNPLALTDEDIDAIAQQIVVERMDSVQRCRIGVAIDFETFYSTKVDYSLTNMPTWHYLHDPRFRAYWVAFYGRGIQYSGPVETAPWDKLIGRPLASHNASFDDNVLHYLQELGLVPDLRTPRMYDTADAVAYLQMPRRLDASSAILLGVTHDKSVRKKMDGKQLEDLSSEERENLVKYGAGDAELCYRLWALTAPLWPEDEQRLSDLNRIRCWEGLRLDQRALDAAIETMELAHFNLLRAMPWVEEGKKPLSPEAIREQGRRSGIPVPASLKMDDPDAMKWEKLYAKEHPWVRAVRGLRRVNSLMLKLQKWKSFVRPDGTAPFQLKYFGAAATGRFSGGGGFNIQNLPKKPAVVCRDCWNCNLEELKDDDDKALPITDDYEVDSPCQFCGSERRFVIDVRGMILAPVGRKFAIADYSQIEARLLLWHAGDKAMLAKIRQGFHIYEAYAREHMNWTGGPLKAENRPLYDLSKALVLGCGYQCWVNGFVRAAKTLARLDFEDIEAKGHVLGYRASNPRVVAYWEWHQKWLAHSAINHDASHDVKLRSGRTIRYFDPRAYVDAKGRPSFRANTVKNEESQRRWFFGGKLTENQMQATSREILRDGMLAIEPLGFHNHFTVHDELVPSVPADMPNEDIYAILRPALTTAAPWALECPLGVDINISDRYGK